MVEIIEELNLNTSFCRKIYYFAEVESTNDLARKFLETNLKAGFSILAKTQSKGQGSHGRFWESPVGGLWSSLVVKPEINLHHLGVIPILTSLGIAKVLNSFNIETVLKWPNDLLSKRNFKKIGGILVEGKITHSKLNYIIIGFGININNSIDQFSPALQNKITSVFIETGLTLSLISVLKQIILEIEKQFNIIKAEGVIPIINGWKRHDNILGMDIYVTNEDGKFYGKAVDISPYGQLVLEDFNKEKIVISTGTVRLTKNDN